MCYGVYSSDALHVIALFESHKHTTCSTCLCEPVYEDGVYVHNTWH